MTRILLCTLALFVALPASAQPAEAALDVLTLALSDDEMTDEEIDDLLNTNPCDPGCYRGVWDAYDSQSTVGKVVIAAGVCGASLWGIWWGLEVGGGCPQLGCGDGGDAEGATEASLPLATSGPEAVRRRTGVGIAPAGR